MKHPLLILGLAFGVLSLAAQSVTIQTEKAGKLATLLLPHTAATELIVSGPMNQPDLKAIGKMMTQIERLDLRSVTFQKFIGEGEDEYYSDNAFPTGINRLKILKELILPSTIKTMSAYSLDGCTGLEKLTIFATVPPGIDYYTLTSQVVYERCKLLVPAESVESYRAKATEGWKFASIEAISTPPTGYPTDHYVLSDDQTKLLSWRGDETAIDMPSDPILSKVKIISQAAFLENERLTDIVLPEALDSIGDRAFFGCKSLLKMNLPASLSQLGHASFALCDGLSAFTITGRSASFAAVDGVLYNADTTILYCYPPAKGPSYTVVNGTKEIAMAAFVSCKKLESLILNDGLAKIGAGAFTMCSSLAEIHLPESIQMIDEFAFTSCTQLRSIKIPSSIETIKSGTFIRCSALEQVTLPSNIRVIESLAFEDCHALTTFVAPESLESIGNKAFNACKALATIKLNATLTSIGEQAFSACESLKRIDCLALDPPACSDAAFLDAQERPRADIDLYVPQAAVEAYRKAPVWSLLRIYGIAGTDRLSTDRPRIYPTVVDDVMYVQSDSTRVSVSYQIVDLKGQTVAKGNSSALQINVTDLTAGQYIVLLYDKQDSALLHTSRIIKK